jgi:hypothetical protein
MRHDPLSEADRLIRQAERLFKKSDPGNHFVRRRVETLIDNAELLLEELKLDCEISPREP